MKKPTDFPLVSVITPVYNAAAYLAETLESVQNQSYEHWELLAVDDNSDDDSLEILQRYAANDPRIKIIRQLKNEGAAAARNKATQAAQGSFIAFLDSDDLWHPEKLAKQLAFMYQHEVAVSFTNYVQIDENGRLLGKRILAMPALSYQRQHANNYIGNLTGMYDVRKTGKILAPSIRKRQDWAVWLEAIKRSKKPAKGLQEDLAYYRIHANNMSANKVKLLQYNYAFYRTYLGYSALKSSLWLLLFLKEYAFHRPKWIENYQVS